MSDAGTITEPQDGWRWKVIWPNPLAQEGTHRAGCLGPCSFWISPKRVTLHPLWVICAGAHIHNKECFPDVKMEPLMFLFVLITIFPGIGYITEKESVSVFFVSSFRNLHLFIPKDDRGEADSLVASWIFLLVVLEVRSDVCFLLVSPKHHILSKIIKMALQWCPPVPFRTHCCIKLFLWKYKKTHTSWQVFVCNVI